MNPDKFFVYAVCGLLFAAFVIGVFNLI